MARHRLCLTTSPQSATSRHSHEFCGVNAGYLATLAHRHMGFELGGWGMDTIIAALEHDDRIRQIELFDSSSFHMELALEAMRKPFPELMV
ncbi:hypothetical protein BGY98DRAFT_47148 [Russula aff. rugulosa BPL654]|nr:hypothetical protein BGY98DRAFT_47148 [Russula aff. rugulosa BPL654]